MALFDDEAKGGSGGLVVHVLCPSLPSPNRFTLNDVAPSASVADLKVRISRSIPSHPTPDRQKLLYLGKLLLDDGVTLQSLFEPLEGSEFSIHLILPPSPSQSTASVLPNLHQASTFQSDPPQTPHLPSAQLRYRAPNPLRPDEIAQSLHENARSRLAELPELRQNDALLPRPQWTRSSSNTTLRQPPWPSLTAGLPNTTTSATATFAPMPNFSLMNLGDGLQLPEDVRARLRLLKQYISLAEEQLNCGIAPTIDHVIQLRTHLFKLLDDQLRRPQSDRGEFIEPLIARVFDVSTRADILRQPRLPPIQTNSQVEYPVHGHAAPLYCLSSPTGYQAVLASSVASDAVRTLGTHTPPATIAAEGRQGQQANPQPNAQANAPPNADAAVMENVVRQAVLNQRPVADGQFGLGRNLRRLWLFIRLYFFCHMFSAPDSSTRFYYVTLALIASILSETSVPRRVYEMVLAPVQRHLEGLVHFTPDEQAQLRPQGAGATGNEATANQRVEVQPVRDGNWSAGIYQNLRRVERSAALFLASLVPGVGERHIEVRNAAEAARNAELARQEEEQRRQQEAAANAEENPPGVGEGNARADDGALNDPQRAIPQEAH